MAQIVDIDVFGQENDHGELITHIGDDAISNAITLWLGSKKGDFLNYPAFGGPLDALIYKPMSMDTTYLAKELRHDIQTNFEGIVKVLVVRIQPDYESRMWIIGIQYQSLLSGQTKVLEIHTNAVASTQPTIAFVDVILTDDNLFNFVLLKQSSIPGEKLVYNDTHAAWVWGPYKFINFGTNSENFTQILNLING